MKYFKYPSRIVFVKYVLWDKNWKLESLLLCEAFRVFCCWYCSNEHIMLLM